MEIAIVVTLLILGIIFFIVELFLIPGISLAGIAGTLFMGGAVYYAYAKISPVAGHITLLGSILLLVIAIVIFIRAKVLEKMSLKADISWKNDPLEKMSIQIGDIGIATSRLAPMGKVKINENIVEAKSNGDFIDQGTKIKVTQVFKTNVLVERIEE